MNKQTNPKASNYNPDDRKEREQKKKDERLKRQEGREGCGDGAKDLHFQMRSGQMPLKGHLSYRYETVVRSKTRKKM